MRQICANMQICRVLATCKITKAIVFQKKSLISKLFCWKEILQALKGANLLI